MIGGLLVSAIRTAFVLSLAVLVLPSKSWANEPAEVEALIEQANDYRRQGMDHKALPIMQKAYNLAHTARTAAQLGLVEITLGYWLQAERHLVEALASTRDPWIHKNRSELERALAGVRTSIGELEVSGSPAGAEVWVNGQPVGKLPLERPTRVGDGPVRVEVRAANWKTSAHALTMVRGQKQRLEVHLERELASLPVDDSTSSLKTAEAAEQSNIFQRGRPVAWFLAAGATVALGFGALETWVWTDKRKEFDIHTRLNVDAAGLPMAERVRDCGVREENRGGDECRRLYDEMTRAKTLAIVGYAVGGLLAAGAGSLFFLSRAEPDGPIALRPLECGVTLPSLGASCRLRF